MEFNTSCGNTYARIPGKKYITAQCIWIHFVIMHQSINFQIWKPCDTGVWICSDVCIFIEGILVSPAKDQEVHILKLGQASAEKSNQSSQFMISQWMWVCEQLEVEALWSAVQPSLSLFFYFLSQDIIPSPLPIEINVSICTSFCSRLNLKPLRRHRCFHKPQATARDLCHVSATFFLTTIKALKFIQRGQMVPINRMVLWIFNKAQTSHVGGVCVGGRGDGYCMWRSFQVTSARDQAWNTLQLW